MKSQVSVLALISIMVSLTQPAWSMEGQGEEEHNKRNGTAALSSQKDPRVEKPSVRKRKQKVNLLFLKKRKEEDGLVNAEDQFSHGQKHGQDKDFQIAFSSANEGHMEAQHDLCVCYAIGRGVKRDIKESMRWCEKAAAQGHVNALTNLAGFYVLGRVVPRDVMKAWELYRQAAQKGSWVARLIVAQMEERVPENEEDAKKLIADGLWNLVMSDGKSQLDPAPKNKIVKTAAKFGHAEAQYALGKRLLDDTSDPKNSAKAFIWLEKAAVQEHLHAQFYLSKCYWFGIRVEVNKTAANFWFQKAKALKDAQSSTANAQNQEQQPIVAQNEEM